MEAWLVRAKPPPLALGIAAGALFVVVETLLVYVFARVASPDALVVIFILGVLVVSWIWGLWLAMAVTVASAATYNILYVPSVRNLDITNAEEWVELAVFLVVSLLAGSMARLARARAAGLAERREEADLHAELAHLMLGAEDLGAVLPEASRCLARAMRLPYAAIERDGVPGDEPRLALPLRYGARTSNLILPPDLPEPIQRRLREGVVPGLERLLVTAIDREEIGISLRASQDELRALATEQASLRRVAVLVARGEPPAGVVAAVTAETASLLDADATMLMREENPGTATVVAEHSTAGVEPSLGQRLAVEGGVTELVLRSSRPARVDSYDGRRGALADVARARGYHSSVAAPITVSGHVWGALVALWSRREPPPSGAEQRLAQFTELLATAVANTESRRQLNASRARIVVAADEARRGIERNLHDGVQQRLVALGLELRAAEASLPAESGELRAQLSRTSEGLANVLGDLREISRGLHPSILSQGGLMAALKTLARRSPVPVTVSPGPNRRMPDCVEVAAYYVVSEALTNAAKHAEASAVDVDVDIAVDDTTGREILVVAVRDDGVGGADPDLGSGLVGLTDRVEALGGQLRFSSPAGHGTSVSATLPIDIDSQRLHAASQTPAE
ncbi:sensor histidine kinase [Dactylosporangium salmoneum]|uniref:histidine kinase n=1 Tax=Dactylosporangium salmoneum TaxID=53361 RepID=A0ABP5UBN9_9ACTN